MDETRTVITRKSDTLGMMHMFLSQCAYFYGIFLLSPNGEESLNIFLNPDPGYLRGETSHSYNNSCIQKSSQSQR